MWRTIDNISIKYLEFKCHLFLDAATEHSESPCKQKGHKTAVSITCLQSTFSSSPFLFCKWKLSDNIHSPYQLSWLRRTDRRAQFVQFRPQSISLDGRT